MADSDGRRGRCGARPRRSGEQCDGDDYGELAEFVMAGGAEGDNFADYQDGELRERYTTAIGTWDVMVADLLGQIAAHAGSLRAGLERLRVPGELRDAWTGDVAAAMDASAAWLAAQPRDTSPRILLSPGIRARRGDAYRDLLEAMGREALAGDGRLDPARLGWRYTVERASWLRIVGDLLGQVVADAGSVERAATVLAVSRTSLTSWVRWFVSRGSKVRARSRWPVAAAGDTPEVVAYDDLIEAVERGAECGDNATDTDGVRGAYTVQLDSWSRMTADLLGQIIADAGSIRRASKVIDVPRSTLGAWFSSRKRGGVR
jgi:hypothetical protein